MRATPEVLGALRLREWALDLFMGSTATPPCESDEAWTLFLGREGCATWLVSILGAGSLPVVLRRGAEREVRQILLLRGEVLRLGAMTAELGIEPVVLKGGVVLAESPVEALSCTDLDLLVPMSDGALFVEELDRRGWTIVGRPNARHFGRRLSPVGGCVEVHIGLGRETDLGGAEVIARSVVLSHPPGWRRPAPADHAWHTLVHATLTHPAYRGRLRDLLLLRRAIQQCRAAERTAIWRRSGSTPEPEVLRAMFAMAVATERLPRWTDPFAHDAQLWYQLDPGAAASGSAPVACSLVSMWAFTSVSGALALWRHFWRRVALAIQGRRSRLAPVREPRGSC